MIGKENPIRGCMAEEHHPHCACLNCKSQNCDKCNELSTQHEIPKSIAKKILGLKNKEYKNYTIKLSTACHRREDKKIPLVLNIMKRLQDEANIVFAPEEVLEMRKNGTFRG